MVVLCDVPITDDSPSNRCDRQPTVSNPKRMTVVGISARGGAECIENFMKLTTMSFWKQFQPNRCHLVGKILSIWEKHIRQIKKLDRKSPSATLNTTKSMVMFETTETIWRKPNQTHLQCNFFFALCFRFC